MAHERKRHLAAALAKAATYSPLVGVIGHRQVGKTTLLEKLSEQYVSLDDENQLEAANGDPTKFLARHRSVGTALDECQLAERLFPALKERVRKDKRPGQFYLSGSIRFTSKKLIRESLTGRIITFDLLPLTLSELDETHLPTYLERLGEVHRLEEVFSGKLSSREHQRRSRLIALYLENGGLPGACFTRNERLRNQRLLSQIETILDRDLRQIVPTTLTLPDLLRFLRELSLHDGNPVRLQELRRRTGITPVTQKKLFHALEAVFLIRTMPIEGDVSGHAIWFEDQAEALFLSRGRLSAENRWNSLVFRNIREQHMYTLGLNMDLVQYRTRAGVLVPLVAKGPSRAIGIIPVLGEPSRKSLAAAHSFLRKYESSLAILVSDRDETRALDDRVWLVPATRMLFPD